MYCRYTVENIPLYDSAEDEPHPGIVKLDSVENYAATTENNVGSAINVEAVSSMESHSTISTQLVDGKAAVTEKNKETESSLENKRQVFSQTNAMISRIRCNSACRNYNIGPSPSTKKRPQHNVKQKVKTSGKKHVCSRPVAELFASKIAQEEIKRYEVYM